jgi:hypothetical protein
VHKASKEFKAKGHSPEIKIGTNGNWFIDGVDTGVSAQGVQGIQGEQGEAGHSPEITIGTNGNWFIDGVDSGVTAKGSQGEIGATGPQGPQGDDGDVGQPGKDGTSLFTDNGAPSATLGKMGDSYIDLDSFDFYVRNETGWVLSGNIKGSDATIVPDYIGSDGLAFYPLNDTECAVSVGTARFLEEIVIPETYKGYKVVRILEEGFSECENLKAISIPDSVTTIGDKAFGECSRLTNVTIGSGVKTIGACVFDYCDKLANIYYIGTEEQWASITTHKNNEYLFNATIYCNGTTIACKHKYDNDCDADCNVCGVVRTPAEHVYDNDSDADCNVCGAIDENRTIVNGTWGGLTWTLNKISGKLVISGTGTMDDFSGISEDAWREYVDVIKSATIENGVTSIGNYAFINCRRLTSITIHESITTIGTGAFHNCNALVEVYNYSSLNIRKGTIDFGNIACYAIDVYTTNESSKLTTDENGFVIHVDGEEKTLVCYVGTETEIVIPSSVTAIKDCALFNCNSITSVTFGENSQLTTIGEMAFADCNGLTSIIIPSNVTTIGRSAFSSCDNLLQVIISQSVTAIGMDAFYGCNRLTDVYYMGTEEQWNEIDIYINATIHFNYVPE